MPDDLPTDLNDATAQRRREYALLTDVSEPDLAEAREAHPYWRQRLAALPHHRRADRREAQEMITRWKQRSSRPPSAPATAQDSSSKGCA